MASPKVSVEARNAEADATARKVDNGYLRLYTGTKPATADAAITGSLVATLRFAATSAPAASGGVVTFSALTQDSNAAGNASPVTHFRAFKSDGTSPVFDGDVSTTAAATGDLQIPNTTINAGTIVQVSSFTYTRPA